MPAPKPFSGAQAPPLEVDASQSAKCAECSNPVFSKGLCRSHYYKNYRSTKSGKQAPEEPSKKKPPAEITEEGVTSLVVTSMQFLATMVDESFSAMDITFNPDRTIKSVSIKPHVAAAVAEMMPWMELYASDLVQYLPWFGLVGGIFGLALPAFDPLCEIIAGVRKPRITRKGPDDIYTETFKQRMAEREAQRRNNQTREQKEQEQPKRAGEKTVLTTVVDADLADEGQGKTG